MATPTRWVLTALFATSSFLAHAAVRDVPAAEINKAVQSDRLSIVLFTSPDVGCKYCIGQSQLFDDFAKTFKGDAQQLRVQWSPWHVFPPAAQLPTTVYGLPSWFVFKSGRVVATSTGKVSDVPALQALFDRASSPEAQSAAGNRKQAATEAGASPPASAEPAPLSTEERSALSMLARIDLIKAALNACAAAFPTRRDADSRRIAAWQEKNNPALQQAARLMLKRSSREDAAAMREITQAQARQLREKAPMTQATQEGCDTVAAALN